MINDLKDLRPSPRNPRKISKLAAKGLGASIERFGDLSGITYNEATGRLVCGHQRVQALEKAGGRVRQTPTGPVIEVGEDGKTNTFPVRIVAWSESDERDANIAANNPHIAGEYTDDLQALLQESLKEHGPDYMSELRLDELLAEQLKKDREAEATDDGYEGDETDGQTVTKRGDIWTLGRHRLVCGDSMTDMGLATQGQRPDLIFTDPPYNCAGNMKSRSFYDNSDSKGMANLAAADWDIDFDVGLWLSELQKHIPVNGSVYICTSHHLAGEIWDRLSDFGANISGYCVWVKSNPMPSLTKRHWTWATELICYATFGKHVFNFPDGENALSWWDIPTQQANRLHPTQKPVEVPSRAITHSSNKGQIVFDPFLGSGTTLIACEQLDRVCVGLEMSERYCDIIVDRWESQTGEKATRD